MVQYLSSEASASLTAAQLQLQTGSLNNSGDLFSERNSSVEKNSGSGNMPGSSEFSSFLPETSETDKTPPTSSENAAPLNVSRETHAEKTNKNNSLSEVSEKTAQTSSAPQNSEKTSPAAQKTSLKNPETDTPESNLSATPDLVESKIQAKISSVASEKTSASSLSATQLKNLSLPVSAEKAETKKIALPVTDSPASAKHDEEKEAFSPALPPVLLTALSPLTRTKTDIKVHLPGDTLNLVAEDTLNTPGKGKKAGAFTEKAAFEKLQKTVGDSKETTAQEEQLLTEASALSKDPASVAASDKNSAALPALPDFIKAAAASLKDNPSGLTASPLSASVSTDPSPKNASTSLSASLPASLTATAAEELKDTSKQAASPLSSEQIGTISGKTGKSAAASSAAASPVLLNPTLLSGDNGVHFSAKLNTAGGTYSVSAKSAKPTVQLGNALVSFISEKGGSEKTLVLQLHPLSLGKIRIEIIGKEGENLNVQVHAENENTLSLLSRDQSEMNNVLQQSGILSPGNEAHFSFTLTPAPITPSPLLNAPLSPPPQAQTSGFSSQNNGNPASFAQGQSGGQSGQSGQDQSAGQTAGNRNLSVNLSQAVTSNRSVDYAALTGKKTGVNITV